MRSAAHKGLRAVVLKGNGKHFQAGADLKWIDAVRASSPEENVRVSRATAEAVQRLNLAPVPTIALVQGGCFGGGTGIVAACDVVIAADNAMFSIAEVRWGLTRRDHHPAARRRDRRAPVAPLRADRRALRRRGGRRIGLVHKVVPLAELEAEGARMVEHVLANGPDAIAETKAWTCARPGAISTKRRSRRWSRAMRPSASRPRPPRGSPRSPRSARGTGRRADGRPIRARLKRNQLLRAIGRKPVPTFADRAGNADAAHRSPRRLAHLRHARRARRGRRRPRASTSSNPSSSASSGRPAAASPRCSTSSRASSRRPAARSASAASR